MPQNHHTFAVFDPPQIGNLMAPVNQLGSREVGKQPGYNPQYTPVLSSHTSWAPSLVKWSYNRYKWP